jgi:protein-disulfide isomerase
MTDFSALDVATQAVMNPAAKPAELRAIAEAQPSLWAQVAVHPNAYPDLIGWLQAKNDAAVKAALAAKRTEVSADGKPPAPPTVTLPAWVVPTVAILAILAIGLAAFCVTLLVNRDTTGVPPASPTATVTVTAAGSAPAQTAPAVTPAVVTPTPSPLGDQIEPPDLSADKSAIVVNPDAPDTALVVDVYVDYQCPVCKAYENFFGSAFEALEQSGDVQMRVHIMSFLDNNIGNDASLRAGIAATCADTVGKFQQYHYTVFANQPQEGTGYTDEQLRDTYAQQAGITGDDLTKFQACYDTWQTAGVVQNMETLNLQAVQATPTFLVNGKSLDMTGLQTIAQNTAQNTAPDPSALLTVLKQAAGVS